MYFIVYVSSAAHEFRTPELLGLLDRARVNNARLGVTGMLVYKDGNFMQVLEGEEAVVRDLATRIGSDSRHRGLIRLIEGPQDQRQFPEWSMGFRDLRSPGLDAVPGFSDFLNTGLTGEEFAADPTRAQKLLLSFKRSMR